MISTTVETLDINAPLHNTGQQKKLKDELFPSRYCAGKPVSAWEHPIRKDPHGNHLRPFDNALDYKLARFFTSSKVPKSQVDEFFRQGLAPSPEPAGQRITFTSGYTLYKKLQEMTDEPQWYRGSADFHFQEDKEFWYRNIIHCVEYLLAQRAYYESLVWAPVREYNIPGERVYSELHTAEWWWETQV